MNPFDKARELTNAIKESDTYKDYQSKKANIEKDEVIKRVVDDFRARQYELEKKQLLGEKPSDEDMKKLQEMFGILSLNPVAEEYLQAEFKFAHMMQEISKILSEVIDQ
ncbi:YlbF family regulator [Guggenheimella bovis]